MFTTVEARREEQKLAIHLTRISGKQNTPILFATTASSAFPIVANNEMGHDSGKDGSRPPLGSTTILATFQGTGKYLSRRDDWNISITHSFMVGHICCHTTTGSPSARGASTSPKTSRRFRNITGVVKELPTLLSLGITECLVVLSPQVRCGVF
jgi:hypothetical protein